MSAAIDSRSDDGFIVKVKIPYVHSMLAFEEAIQAAVNDVGATATQEALEQFDTDGSPIQFGDTKLFSKGSEPKTYQTPYGGVSVSRHVYQSAKGGKTFCPLEQDARIIITSTPKFARSVASKYADMGSSRVQTDLRDNHGRATTRAFIQTISEAVGAVLAAKEDVWHYTIPETCEPIHSIAIGLDGTMMLLCEDGYREAMVGTLALYDQAGDRQHTIYLAASPEYGKATFLAKLEAEINHLKSTWPDAHYIGLADGATCNWGFLARHTERQTIDYWHAAEYLGKAAGAMFRGKRQAVEKVEWLDKARHQLKHHVGGATPWCGQDPFWGRGADGPQVERLGPRLSRHRPAQARSWQRESPSPCFLAM